MKSIIFKTRVIFTVLLFALVFAVPVSNTITEEVGITTTVNAKSKKKSKKSKKKGQVITVKKADQTTAKKIYDVGMQGKTFTIQYKCKSTSKKNIKKGKSKLVKLCKSLDNYFPQFNDLGVNFGASEALDIYKGSIKQSGRYVFIVIKSDSENMRAFTLQRYALELVPQLTSEWVQNKIRSSEYRTASENAVQYNVAREFIKEYEAGVFNGSDWIKQLEKYMYFDDIDRYNRRDYLWCDKWDFIDWSNAPEELHWINEKNDCDPEFSDENGWKSEEKYQAYLEELDRKRDEWCNSYLESNKNEILSELSGHYANWKRLLHKFDFDNALINAINNGQWISLDDPIRAKILSEAGVIHTTYSYAKRDEWYKTGGHISNYVTSHSKLLEMLHSGETLEIVCGEYVHFHQTVWELTTFYNMDYNPTYHHNSNHAWGKCNFKTNSGRVVQFATDNDGCGIGEPSFTGQYPYGEAIELYELYPDLNNIWRN